MWHVCISHFLRHSHLLRPIDPETDYCLTFNSQQVSLKYFKRNIKYDILTC